MFQKTSLTTIIVGVFIVYVLHTCWVMYGIVYTKPCEKPRDDNCISPYLAGKPRLQVSIMHRLTFPMLSHVSVVPQHPSVCDEHDSLTHVSVMLLIYTGEHLHSSACQR